MQVLATPDVMPNVATRSPHELIRNTALHMFVERGYQSVSLRQLASAIGMQAGSLYNHIESKEALLFELIEAYEIHLLQALPGKLLILCDPLKALNAFIKSHVAFTFEHRQRWLLARLEYRCLAASQQGRIIALRQDTAERLGAILQAGMDQGRFVKVPVRTMVPCMLAMLNEISSWHSPGYTSSLTATVGLHTKMIHAVLLPSAMPMATDSTEH